MEKSGAQTMTYNFDELPDRRNSECVKWHAHEEDVLPMWVADMDVISPEPVIRALHDRVNHGVFGYPRVMPELEEVIVARLADLYQWHIQPEDIVFTPGVVKGFNLACQVAAQPGGGVLVNPPIYYPILYAPKNADMFRQDVELTLTEDGSYQIDWAAFETAVSEQTCLFILCNPHNPVGRVFKQDELSRMAEICLQHNITICSDEIHCDLVFKGHRHIPIATLDPEIAQNTITLMAASKTFNVAGLQCSFAVIENPDLRERFKHAGKGLVCWVNVMGMVATEAAYRHGQEWLDELMLYLEANRDYAYEYVSNQLPGISMAKPEGTYLAWLDCREAGIKENPYTFFLEKARVAMNDGAAFGRGGEGFVRLNFGCPRSLLTEALERMLAAIPTSY
jgi:cystathionine beta-lyase